MSEMLSSGGGEDIPIRRQIWERATLYPGHYQPSSAASVLTQRLKGETYSPGVIELFRSIRRRMVRQEAGDGVGLVRGHVEDVRKAAATKDLCSEKTTS